MKVKLHEVVNSLQSLQALGMEKMPIKLAYNIQRNMRLLSAEMDTYEKSRVDLIKSKYGTEQEDGSYQVSKDNMPEYRKEMETLGMIEVDLDMHTITIADFGDIKVAPIALDHLDWMIKEL